MSAPPKGVGCHESVRRGRQAIIRLAFLFVSLLTLAAASRPDHYSNDFETAKIGPVPDDIMVLDGTFAIVSADGNKYLELAGDPVGSFGALLGPAFGPVVDVKARVWGAAAGKRFPEFGIGAGDAGGFKLFLAPGRHLLEIRSDDQTQATAPAEWKSGTWTWLRLRIEQHGAAKWVIRGKVWSQDQKEPEDWTITTETASAPPGGKVSFWGEAFSEKPIRFDDLSVSPVK